jgi:hypothetical protein
MKSTSAAHGYAGVPATIIFAGMLCTISPALMAQTPSPSEAERESWRRTILETPRPGTGCSTATYPETEWREVPCKTPSHKLYPPKRRGTARTNIVGGSGSDFSAVVTGFITEAETGSLIGCSDTGSPLQ